MVVAISLVFFIASFFALFEEKLAKDKWYVYILLGIALIVIATVKPLGVDNDSYTYEDYFFNYDSPIFENTVEFSYLWLSKLFYHAFKDVHYVFFVYALLGVTIKFLAFKRLSPMPFLVVSVYVCTSYVLHEFTQIRAGVATGFILLSLKPMIEGRKLHAVGYILLAFVFHYSSILAFPLLLLSNNELTKRDRMKWVVFMLSGYVIYFLHIQLAALPIPYIGDKLEGYQNLKDQGFMDEVNVFNLVYLTKIAIFCYLMYFYDTIREHNKYFPFMMKIFSLSLFCFTALSSVPAICFRVSELYGIVSLILYTNIYYTIRPSWLGKLTVIAISFTLFCITVFYNKLIQY